MKSICSQARGIWLLSSKVIQVRTELNLIDHDIDVLEILQQKALSWLKLTASQWIMSSQNGDLTNKALRSSIMVQVTYMYI